ncbi:MAG: hypothetical protein K2X77_11815 [Candidatus Obscuribacterales bacterium]|jgi:bacterioferritin|nr:hypothetical protein [Candidatus Obscuribacterales bacterium]
MSESTSTSGNPFSAAPDGDQSNKAKTFSPNVQELRQRARKDVEEGAVTKGYPAEKEAIIKMLDSALATELVCVLRYRKHYYMAKGIDSEPVAQEFLEHANEELAHADKLAVRIAQLGGEPDLNPKTLLERSHSEYIEADNLKDMINENLVAERIAIDSYRAMIDFIGGSDPTTRRILEEILEVEEEHADELADLISK